MGGDFLSKIRVNEQPDGLGNVFINICFLNIVVNSWKETYSLLGISIRCIVTVAAEYPSSKITAAILL